MMPSEAITFVADVLEGPQFTHDPEPTMYGITQGIYDSYRKLNGKATQTVANIQRHEVVAIYNGNFWIPMKCSSLPDGLDLALFQAGVNIGPARAVKMLQSVLDVQADGVIGPKTIAAAKKGNAGNITAKFLKAQDAYYDNIYAKNEERNAPYIKGWHNRVAETKLFLATGLTQGGAISITALTFLALLGLLLWVMK